MKSLDNCIVENITIVSVIVPVYNVSQYLTETLDSIIKQTYKNIEIILVDDGSTDGSGLLCDELSMKDERIKVFHNPNKGVSYARNYGIERSIGKYIMPVDGDDVIAPTYIEKSVEIMESNENVGIVYCETVLFGKRSGKWDLPEFSLNRMLVENVIPSSAMYRRRDWQTIGGYSEEMTLGIEDYEFWLSILELNRKVYQIPEPLFHYRIRNNSRTENFEQDKENLLAMYNVIYRKHRQLYVNNFDIFANEMRLALLIERAKLIKSKRFIPFNIVFEKCPIIKNTIKNFIFG